VGGTNPSLIEAMGCGAVICAHDNVFNRSILNENGLFFRSVDDIRQILSSNFSEKERNRMRDLNKLYVKQDFSWEKIAEDYLHLFRKALL
jgi:glycosyltransferase involved in cell wall biosynthesis